MPKILLVDDVELFLELEKSFLAGQGYGIETARSGEEMLLRIEDVAPDLVLLDLYMTGMDGDEVCRRLRTSERWKTLPLIMVTAAGKDEEVRRCLAAGCDDYVTKPINRSELLLKVKRLLGRQLKRANPRAAVKLAGRIKAAGRSFEVEISNLSQSGLHARGGQTLPVGSPLAVEVSFGEEILSVVGKVKHVEEGPQGGMGIYFVRPDLHGEKLIGKVLEHFGPGSDLTGIFLRTSPEQEIGPSPDMQGLEEERRRLLQRVEELEAENREFALELVRVGEINNNLANLYVASHRLHSTLCHAEVLELVREVVINLVGAEKFALLEPSKEGDFLEFKTGEGFEQGEFPALVSTEGIFGDVLCRGQSYYSEQDVAQGSDEIGSPLALVPMMIHGRTVAVLAVYRLFIQKNAFTPLDFQLFSMLAEHAATALFSSALYEESERKRSTYKGFMDLLLKPS